MCSVKQHMLYILTLYFFDTLRDIKSFKIILPIIFKSLTSSNSNLFKNTENPFHIFFFFFYLCSVFWKLKHFEGTQTGVVVLLKCCEWLLQFKSATINSGMFWWYAHPKNQKMCPKSYCNIFSIYTSHKN